MKGISPEDKTLLITLGIYGAVQAIILVLGLVFGQ